MDGPPDITHQRKTVERNGYGHQGLSHRADGKVFVR